MKAIYLQLHFTKTFEKIKRSSIIVYLFDVHELSTKELQAELDELKKQIEKLERK